MIKTRDEIIQDLKQLFKYPNSVISNKTEMSAFETDAYFLAKEMPLIVLLPNDEDEISKVCKYCYENEINLVMRGAGTSLSGGATPNKTGILMVTSKLNKIKDIDFVNRCVTVEPGVTNIDVSTAVDEEGFFYGPDPSSQTVCTIGGNVAENSGGIHCLKYGLTTNNILAVRAVLITGEIITFGSKARETNDLDLLAVLTGSEGLLAVITEVTVKIIPKPESLATFLVSFSSVKNCADCVSEIIAQGIIPAGLEMMDHDSIKVCDDYCKAGYRRDAMALLIIEIDGTLSEVEENTKRIDSIAKKFNSIEFRIAKNSKERNLFWLGRKQAFPAAAVLAPDFLVIDCTIPRRLLAKILDIISDLADKYGLKVLNVFHAGDGNLHPLILFDGSKSKEVQAVKALSADIMKTCVDHGGVLSGEHGIGLEKKYLMTYQFTKSELDQQLRVKCAFDEKSLLNPGKMFPKLHRCAEMGMLHVKSGKIPFPEIERF